MLLTGTEGALLDAVAGLAAAVAAAAGQPAPPVRRPARDLEGPMVVVIDDPVAALMALVAGGTPPAGAARALSAQTAPLVTRARDAAAVLRRETTVESAVAALRAAMGIADDTMLPGWDPAAPLAGSRPDKPTREICALATEVVAPLFAAAASGKAQPVLWSRDALFWGDRPGERLPRIIDLTGPARVLAYGPYCHLPPGGWTVRTTLAFSPAAVGVPFAVELHGEVLLGRGRFRPAAPGVFAASFPARVTDPHAANEIRVLCETGAIEGEIGVDHVRLVPLPA